MFDKHKVNGSIPFRSNNLRGGMVDALDSKSSAFWLVGSSPSAGRLGNIKVVCGSAKSKVGVRSPP